MADLLWDRPAIPRFADVLPHQLYDSENDLYGLANGRAGEACGFILEALAQIGTSEQIERSMQEMPMLLPPGFCLQVTLYADPDVQDQLSRYCRLRPGEVNERGSDIFRKIARRRFSHLKGLSGELAVCDFRLFFTVSTRGRLANEETREKLIGMRSACTALLEGCSIPSLRLPPAELVNLLGGLLNPKNSSRRGLAYENSEFLNRQCLLRDTEIEIGAQDICVRGDGMPHSLCALTASKYPGTLRLPAMLRLLGDPVRPHLRYRGPFAISTVVQGLDQETARMLVSLRSARAASNARSVMGWLMPSYYRRQHEDWRTTADVLDHGGHLVWLSHHLLAIAPPEQLEESVEAARAVWRASGFTLSRCVYLQTLGLLAALPLGVTPAAAEDMRKLGWLGRKTSHNAAHGMPVLAEWKGTRTPALLLIGRRGQLMNLDLFDAEGNRNAIVAGASGTGKSVLLNELAATSLALGASVWILDIGRSYQNICELLGGQFLEFNAASKHSLNPFSAVVDINEDMRLLAPLFSQMIAPRGGLDDFQRARLEEALLATWNEHGNSATPDHLRSKLLLLAAADSRIADMAAMLWQYTAAGSYGRWFDRPSTIDLSSRFVVAELEDIKSLPELQVVVLMQLLFQITQRMYADASQRKLVLIDEAWDLLRGEHVAEFIEHGYRRSRKYNGAFVSASQSISDFCSSPAGRAAMGNSDWQFLLAQKGEELRRLISTGQLDLDDSEQELLRSVHTRSGEYAEIFVRCTSMGSAVGRLSIDPYSRLLFSTNPHDRSEIAKQRQADPDLAKAISVVLAQRGEISAT